METVTALPRPPKTPRPPSPGPWETRSADSDSDGTREALQLSVPAPLPCLQGERELDQTVYFVFWGVGGARGIDRTVLWCVGGGSPPRQPRRRLGNLMVTGQSRDSRCGFYLFGRPTIGPGKNPAPRRETCCAVSAASGAQRSESLVCLHVLFLWRWRWPLPWLLVLICMIP